MNTVMDFVCSPLPAVAMGLVLIFVTFVILRHGRRLHEKKKRYHPVAGTVLHQLINLPRLFHYMTKLAHKHKTCTVIGLFRNDVYTADPVNVEYILKTNFANYGKGSYHYAILSDALGDGIFVVDGEKWVHQRKVLNYELSSKGMRDLSIAVFKTNAVKLAGIISEAANCNQAIEIQGLFMKSSLDSIVKILFGIDLDTIYGKNEEGTQFSNAFDLANETTFYRHVDYSWKIKRFLNIGSEAVLKNSIKVMDQFVYKLIKSKIQTVHDSAEELPALHSSKLVELGETDLKYTRDMILSILVAGKDTTTTTLSWFLYVLCKNVHLQEKIVQEVKHVTNQKDNSSFDELAASLTDEALDGMHYLHAALNETLRLYPAAPLNARICLSDDTWPDGFSVKKGSLVAYNMYAMGRMKFIWGDDAEEFRPERWLNENGFVQQDSPFKFIAFSAGPRICLGKEFAYRQMKILSALLLRSYIFKLSDENKVPHYRTMVTFPIAGGLHVQAFPRPN